MELTVEQCNLLRNMINASIERASQSGIPIHKDFYKTLNHLKEKLQLEMQMAIDRENKKWF